jgi:transposase
MSFGMFADSLSAGDEVALEATGNSWAVASVLARRGVRVVVSNPYKTRAIVEAKVKMDKIDAAVLAELLAANFLPAMWMPDEGTHLLRRLVVRRTHLVRQRTGVKNQVQAVLHRNLIPRCPAADLFGHKGRKWLAAQDLPADERQAVTGLLRQLDFFGEELRGGCQMVCGAPRGAVVLDGGERPSSPGRRSGRVKLAAA